MSKRITHTTKWIEKLEARANSRGVNRCVIIEEIFKQEFNPSSLELPPVEPTEGKCCLECSYEKCNSGACPHDYATRKVAEDGGYCAGCHGCPDWTPKPKEES